MPSEAFIRTYIDSLLRLDVVVDLYADSPPPSDVSYAATTDGLTINYRQLPDTRKGRIVGLLGTTVKGSARFPLGYINPRFGTSALSGRLAFAAANWPRIQADAVHAHFGSHAIEALRYIDMTQEQSPPLFVTFHGGDLHMFSQNQGRRRYRHLFERASHIFTVSDELRRKAVAFGCQPSKVTTHRLGVDCDVFSYSSHARGGDGTYRVLMVGRLTEKKGHEVALKAFQAFLEHVPKAQLRIVGDGPLRAHLASEIERRGLSSSVEVLGALDHAGVKREMRAAQLLLAPSVEASGGDREGVPVVLMEAMSSGLPVVSSYHGGIPELISSGTDGLLCPEGDAEAVVTAMMRLSRDADYAETLAANARARVERDFNAEIQAQTLLCMFASHVS